MPTFQLVIDLEAEPRQALALLVLGDRDADDLLGALGSQPDHGALREVRLDVGVAGPARAGELDEQLRRVDRRRLGELGRDALLPARLRLRAHVEPLAAAEDAELLEVRGLEQHRRASRPRPRSPRRP